MTEKNRPQHCSTTRSNWRVKSRKWL